LHNASQTRKEKNENILQQGNTRLLTQTFFILRKMEKIFTITKYGVNNKQEFAMVTYFKKKEKKKERERERGIKKNKLQG